MSDLSLTIMCDQIHYSKCSKDKAKQIFQQFFASKEVVSTAVFPFNQHSLSLLSFLSAVFISFLLFSLAFVIIVSIIKRRKKNNGFLLFSNMKLFYSQRQQCTLRESLGEKKLLYSQRSQYSNRESLGEIKTVLFIEIIVHAQRSWVRITCFIHRDCIIYILRKTLLFIEIVVYTQREPG